MPARLFAPECRRAVEAGPPPPCSSHWVMMRFKVNHVNDPPPVLGSEGTQGHSTASVHLVQRQKVLLHV